MGLFKRSEPVQLDEASMHKFWEWFKDYRESDIFENVKEINIHLQKIYGLDGNAHWMLGYHHLGNMCTILFFPDGKRERAILKRLAELAPADVKEKWNIQIE